MISECLLRIRQLLYHQWCYWASREHAKATIDRIDTYMAATALLEDFVKEKDLWSFVEVFYRYRISIPQLRACFLSQGDHDTKPARLESFRLISSVCKRIAAILDKESIRADANRRGHDVARARDAFNGCSREADEAFREETTGDAGPGQSPPPEDLGDLC
jgi:hypothetical protein